MSPEKIAIVTDSTADLPLESAERFGVHVIPLKIIFGNKSYRDGIDITSNEFYRKLQEEEKLPKTSQPTPYEFEHLYKRLLQGHDKIISIHLSRGLSGTVDAARHAATQFGDKVKVWDSKSISLGIGLQVLNAVEAVHKGLGIDAIMEKLTRARENTEVLFTLNTLEYLQKGGRIGKVTALLGSILNIKPIVRVIDGIYHPCGKSRSQKGALKLMIKKLQEIVNERKVTLLGVAHGAAHSAAKYIKQELEDIFNIRAEIFTQVGPGIGVHTGPGTVGAVVQFEH